MWPFKKEGYEVLLSTKGGYNPFRDSYCAASASGAKRYIDEIAPLMDGPVN